MDELQWRESVEATKKGDKKAFEKLYRQTERAVYFTCLKLLAGEDNAKDTMQDTYMTALDKLDTLDDGAKFPMWINRIAINKCKNKLVKIKDDSLDEKIEQGTEFKDDESFIPEEYVTNEAKRKVIMDIIDRVLSDVQRQTIILYYYDQLSLEDIAEIMDCPVKTVSSRLCSAREKIKEAVLIYEEANDDRLHMLVPIPILTQILLKEAQSISVPDISPMLLSSQFFNAAANAFASTSTTVVAGGSKMTGLITAKIAAAIIGGVVAVGGITTAVVVSTSSDSSSQLSASSSLTVSDQSSLTVSDQSSKAPDSSSQSDSAKQTDSSNTETTTTTTTTTSSNSTAAAANSVEWTVEDLSAFFDANVKGKPIAEAQKAINEKFGTDPSKWTAQTSYKYTNYMQELPIPIKVYNAVFKEIWIAEVEKSGTIDAKSKYAGLGSYYKEKGYAENAEKRMCDSIKADGFKHDDNTFMQMWYTKSGEFSIGATSYKTYRGRLGIVFWPRLTWGR